MKKLVVIGLILMELGIITYIETKPLWENKELKNEQKELNQGKKEDLPKTMYALMLEQTPGQNDYVEDNRKEFPKDGYKFNPTRSGCVDKNGNTVAGILSYDDVSKKIIVTTNMTVYCYVYFDIDNSIPVLPASTNEYNNF